MKRTLDRASGLLLVLAIVAGLFFVARARDPYQIDTDRSYARPSIETPFGTDALGRDMLARTGYAAGLSLRVALQSMAFSFGLALFLGAIAGYTAGRWPDKVITWTISLLFTIPFILVVVAIFAVMEPTMTRAYLVIGCIGWAAPARLVRNEVMQIRSSLHVLAERSFGFSNASIIFRSILPACFLPALLSLLYFLPELIGIEVGLAFFGLGAKPPTPTLGRLIYDGLSEFSAAWWLPLLPAAVLLLVTLGVNISTSRLAAVAGSKEERG